MRWLTWYLTQWHPRSVRSLAYMLQQVEYHPRALLAWYVQANDFRHVEYRGRISWTTVARVCFGFGWVVVFLWCTWSITWAPLLLILTPFVLVAALAAACWSWSAIGRPYMERRMLVRIRTRLALHPGIRIAIAGSYGKTSMREIVRTILSQRKRVAAVPENHNTPAGVSAFVDELSGDEEVLVFELGEYYPGDVRMLADAIRPQWGIITGVNEAHLERFGTLKQTTDAIFELAAFVTPDHLYVHENDALVRERHIAGSVPYTKDGSGQWSVERVHVSLTGTDIVLGGTEEIAAHTSLIGAHHVGPITAAADIASRLGITPVEIRVGITALQPVPHRLAPRMVGGVLVIDDTYNGNIDGVRAGLALLKQTTGRRWYVTPGLVETGHRTKELHRTIGSEIADAGIEHVVLIRTSVTSYILDGLREHGYTGAVQWFDDMPDFLRSLPIITVPGDIVLMQNDWPDGYR